MIGWDWVGKLPSIQLAQANLQKCSTSNNTFQVVAKIPIVSITKILRNYNHKLGFSMCEPVRMTTCQQSAE